MVVALASEDYFIFAQRVASGGCSRNSINLGKIIDSLLHNYDTHLLPNEQGTNVTIELHVQGITGISVSSRPLSSALLYTPSALPQELTADFELDVMYSEIWRDSRLAFKPMNVCATNITLKVQRAHQ